MKLFFELLALDMLGHSRQVLLKRRKLYTSCTVITCTPRAHRILPTALTDFGPRLVKGFKLLDGLIGTVQLRCRMPKVMLEILLLSNVLSRLLIHIVIKREASWTRRVAGVDRRR